MVYSKCVVRNFGLVLPRCYFKYKYRFYYYVLIEGSGMFKSLPFDPNDELLTPLETAKILKMTVGTLAVCRSTKTKELKWLKLGKSVRYRRS